MRKAVALLLLLLLTASSLALLLPTTVSAKTIIVPDDYATIQEAVESASDGDIISVKAGRYFGNIIIDKSVQIIGESPDSTTVYGDYISEEDKNTFQVNAPSVVIADLTISNEDTSGKCVNINANDCEVWNNIFPHVFGTSQRAINAEDCSDLSLTGNSFNGSIYLENISGGIISENIMVYRDAPMTVLGSSNLVISDNDMSEFSLGIYDYFNILDGCSNCQVQNNLFGSGDVFIMGSPDCSFLDNTGPNVNLVVIESPNIQLKRNSFGDFGIDGFSLADYIGDIDSSNTANGKPIYYLMNRSNLEITQETHPTIGALYIINSTNIEINKLSLDTCSINLVATTDSEITENNVTGHSITLRHESNQNVISRNNLDEASISIVNSSNNNIMRNTFNQNTIVLDWSAVGNRVVGNSIVNSYTGIFIFSATGNTIYHNNFIGYHNTVTTDSVPESANNWTNYYPGGGNYWGYTGTDEKNGSGQSLTGPDAIIDSAKQDGDVYPLAAPVQFLDSSWNGEAVALEFITNSTLSDLRIDDATKSISFNATGSEGTTGFSRITLPNSIARDAWKSEYSITVNNQEVTFTTLTDTANTYNYFTFQNQPEPTPSPEPTHSPEPTSTLTPEPTPTEKPQPSEQDMTVGAILAVASIVVFLGLLVYFIKRR